MAKRPVCRKCGQPLSDEDIAMHRSEHWDCPPKEKPIT